MCKSHNVYNKPLQEIIELDFDNLPDDGEEVLAILRGEHATLNFWVDLAVSRQCFFFFF